VRMKFSVKRDGKLLRVASAVPTPDWAVRQASQVIRSAAPFPPLPPEPEGTPVEPPLPVDSQDMKQGSIKRCTCQADPQYYSGLT